MKPEVLIISELEYEMLQRYTNYTMEGSSSSPVMSVSPVRTQTRQVS